MQEKDYMGKHTWDEQFSEAREHMLQAAEHAHDIATGASEPYTKDYEDYRDYHVKASQAAREHNL